jgi:succinoglycan biosynthesis protein ExoV
MRLVYYRGKRPNFGDDLNAELWPRLLPPEALAADNAALVGIGSILTEEWVGDLGSDGERVVVLGSGTSYDVPPARIADWSVLAVRGPLTASLIGLPETAVTDGAILLAAAPELIGPEAPRTDVLFMPHHRSIRRSPWATIAEEAGMRLVSPQQTVREILDAYSSARLVVTEAMHGAIVADTLRIPWIPVTIAPTVDELKWRDWCLSMSLPYEPATVPAGDARDSLRYRRMQRILQRSGVHGHRNLEGSRSREELTGYLDRRFSPATKSALLRADRGGWSTKIGSAVATVNQRSGFTEAVAALRDAQRLRPCLSAESVFRSRLEEMQSALDRAGRLVTAG